MNQFADVTWTSRWNNPDSPHLYASQIGSEVYMTTFMGALRFSLDNADDCRAIADQAQMVADKVRELKAEYDGICDRCQGSPARHWSVEICKTCDNVRLCEHCFNVHKLEVAGGL
jgi:hypothetical protein